jgi:hypothetical protein
MPGIVPPPPSHDTSLVSEITDISLLSSAGVLAILSSFALSFKILSAGNTGTGFTICRLFPSNLQHFKNQ